MTSSFFSEANHCWLPSFQLFSSALHLDSTMGEISGPGPGVAGTSALLPLTSPVLLMALKDSQSQLGTFSPSLWNCLEAPQCSREGSILVQLCCLSGSMLWGRGKGWGGSWKAGEVAVKTNPQEAARWGGEVDTSSILDLYSHISSMYLHRGSCHTLNCIWLVSGG